MKKSTKFVLGALGCAAAAAGLAALAVAPGKADEAEKAKFYGRNFAHRGLHSYDKSVPENSLAAFRLAVEAGYGMELDVQLSKDGKVVVFHDDDLNRVCGVDKRVDELTFDELRELRLCETEEVIPLFSEVLDLVAGRQPIICELKTGRRNNKLWFNNQLCEKTLELIEFYDGDVCIESFDPFIVAWFREHAKHLIRGQLAQPAHYYKNEGLNAISGFVLANTVLNVLSRPNFIAYRVGGTAPGARLSKALGAMDFCWTSHNSANEEGRDAVIFEFYKPESKFK